MERFWDLLAQSVIVQGILTLGVTTAVFVLMFSAIEVPKEVWTLLGLAWGFYFGGKSQMALMNMKKRG